MERLEKAKEAGSLYDREFSMDINGKRRYWFSSEPMRRMNSLMDDLHICNFDQPDLLRQPCEVENSGLKLDGSNLATVLFMLHKDYPKKYRMITDVIKQADPNFGDFSFNLKSIKNFSVWSRKNKHREKVNLMWSRPDDVTCQDISILPNSTLRLAALATLLLQPDEYKPGVILLAEPAAEFNDDDTVNKFVAAMIHDASQSSQIIMETTSERLLEQFNAKHKIMIEQDENSLSFIAPEEEDSVIPDEEMTM